MLKAFISKVRNEFIKKSSFSKPFSTANYNQASETYIGTIIQSTAFVDKSLLIKKFLEYKAQNLLITYPRRWGKSINLSMIDQFLRAEVDHEGKILASDKRENFKLFAGGKIDLGENKIKLLKPLKISTHQDIMNEFQGKYPVIYLDFLNAEGTSYQEIENQIKIQIRNLYTNDHRYLKKYISSSDQLLEVCDKKKLNNYFDGNFDKTELTDGLPFLSKLLYNHFGKRPFILFDEYDAPINYACLNFKYEKNLKRVVDLFRQIFTRTLKNNQYVEKSLITGVLRIAKQSLFSGLNNLCEFNIDDEEFANYYGFLEEEVIDLLKQHQVHQDVSNEIKSWYNGYQIGSYEIYNPWSIVNVLNAYKGLKDKYTNIEEIKQRILKSYWEESGSIAFIDQLFKEPHIREKIETLIKDEVLLNLNLTKSIELRDYQILKELMNQGSLNEVQDNSADLLFSFLYYSGYLTKAIPEGYKLPNEEIKREFQKKLRIYYIKKYRFDLNLFKAATDILQKMLDSKDKNERKSLIEKDFKEAMEKIFGQLPIFQKIKEQDLKTQCGIKRIQGNEEFAHDFMTVVTCLLKDPEIYGTKMRLGRGIPDITFVDYKNRFGVIIELKYGQNAQKAIDQIKQRQFPENLKTPNMDIILLGMNVSNTKDVEIQYEEVSNNKK